MTIKITVAGKFDRKTGKLLICDIPKKCVEEIGEIIEDESSNESQNYYEIVLIELKVKVEEISSEKNKSMFKRIPGKTYSPNIRLEMEMKMDIKAQENYFPDILSDYQIHDYKRYNSCNLLYLKKSLLNSEPYDKIYSNLLSKVLSDGISRNDRTGTGTLSTFGEHFRINVEHNLPIITKKWVAWKSVIKELLWFLKGETDAKILDKQGVKIWNGNTSKEFLKSRNLDYEEGELGPGYGWQIRRSGAEYPNKEGGIDQLKYIENEIKNKPESRRIMWNLWNPKDLDKMTLVPCHNQIQLYCGNDNKLSICVSMRSNDLFLGNPFNVFSYYVLLRILCLRLDKTPYEIIFNIGDCHIYKNHIEQAKEVIKANTKMSPVLHIDDKVKYIDYEEMDYTMFDLVGYFPMKEITAKMSV